MVGAWASAARFGTVVSATAATRTSTSAMRSVVIDGNLPEKWLNLAHAYGQHHPLTALTAARGAQRRERALDAEMRRETALHLRARNGKRRARGHAAHGEEAREEPAARLHDGRQHAHVLVAPA